MAAFNINKLRNPALRDFFGRIFAGTDSVTSLDVTTLKVGGATVTASAAEINKLDNAGAVVASGTAAAVIADPTGGTTTDAEARAAINSLIDALQAFGIVASE